MERGLLSDKKLAAHYGDVVWLYLFQDFSHSAVDRAAERVAIRFGISSWPQHFLVDPFTLMKIADTGRGLPSFAAAIGRVNVREQACTPSQQDLQVADALARDLEQADVAKARKHMRHADPVVVYRALQTVAGSAPSELVSESAALLGIANDQIRGLVCDVLAEHGDTKARDALHALVRKPEGSANPNVLRGRAVKALGRCGDASSLGVIGPFACSGAYRNFLTQTSVRSVAAIGGRLKSARKHAVALLATAYPVLPESTTAVDQRMCVALAKKVHDALETLARRRVEFPAEYSAEARERLMKSW